jgi:rfaE bifunctional protein nucleotidyltransferase chain/domain
LGKIYKLADLKVQIQKWREVGKKIVFTNGCFDLLHRGHIEYLRAAKTYGDILIVGLNSDTSVRRLKGKPRPFTTEEDRAFVLVNLLMVDAVCLFEQDTPQQLIAEIKPDVLVKGGDYKKGEIIGKDIVERHGGQVLTVPLVKDRSTSLLIDKIRNEH